MSCATPYQSSGWRGGYSDKKLSSDIYQVSFNGNGFTGETTAHNYMLKRAAEIALINGYSHFIVLDGKTDSDFSIHTNSYGQVNSVSKPNSNATIKLINNPPSNIIAYDALIVFGENTPQRKAASLPRFDD
jgi:hypothetical protein